MKLKHYLCLFAVVLISILLEGCECTRNSAMVTVKDIGPFVTTRYRYNLTSENWELSSKYADSLKKRYPNVFSSSGLRFVVIQSQKYKYVQKYLWTNIFAIAGGIIPAFPEESISDSFTIKMVDDGTINDGFDLIYTREQTFSGFLPTAWIIWGGKKDGGGNFICQRHTKHGLDVNYVPNLAICDGNDLTFQAFAYGVVAKLKEMEDSGKIDAMLRRLEAAKSKVPEHRVVKFARASDNDFAYMFTLELASMPNDSERVVSAVMEEFSKSVKEDYLDTYPTAKETSLVVEFSNVNVDDRRIQGRATVLAMKPLSLSYDPNTRRGKLSVRFNPGQEAAARAWISRNLETMARDKNIMLVTGQQPPAGNYYSLDESIKDNVMEIEFKTE